MRMAVVTACLSLVLATQSTDVSAKPRFFIYGHGTHACERLSEWQPEDVAQHDPYLQWILGFVTGVGSLKIPLAEVDAGKMWGEVSAFCAQNPQADVATAAGRLAESLSRRSAAGDRFVIHGVGVAKCPAFVAGLDGESARQRQAYAQWPAGFVTGVGSAGVPLREWHIDKMAGWLREHCSSNPSDAAGAATARMVERELHRPADKP